MNDRFKFRAYDKKNNILVYCWHEATEEQRRLYETIYGEDETYNCWQCCQLDCLNGYGDDFIIEQCTGLKDKNGKLIYEGDILKPNVNTIMKEVVYEDGSYWAKDTIYFHDKCHIFQKWIDECGDEIVGNIHEKEEE